MPLRMEGVEVRMLRIYAAVCSRGSRYAAQFYSGSPLPGASHGVLGPGWPGPLKRLKLSDRAG